jgi:tRNA(Ile2) C34 agmatinyltransferase TiaS
LRVKEDVGDAENERCYCANKMSSAKKRYFWCQFCSLELPARNLHHKDIYIRNSLGKKLHLNSQDTAHRTL